MKILGSCPVIATAALVVLDITNDLSEITTAWYDGENFSDVRTDELKMDDETNQFYFQRYSETWWLDDFLAEEEEA